jgi:hypothetical protein
MNDPPMSTQIMRNPVQQKAVDTRLYGRWLVLARTAWVALVILTVGIFITSLPIYITQLQSVCVGEACAYMQISPQQAQALQGSGFSIGGYATYTAALVILSAVVCFGVGGVIFWRKSDDWMALLFALLFALCGTIFVSETVEASHSLWRLPNLFLNELTFAFIFLVFSLFPDGRFVPHWTRWLLIGYLAAEVLHIYTVFPDTPLGQVRYPPLLLLVWFGELVLLLFAQIYRYRHVSSLAQRQQTKWIVFGVTVAIIMGGLSYLPLILPRLSSLDVLFTATVSTIGLLLAPLFTGIAILRFRLWDIDIIINRTLVYSLLTATLAILYVSSIIALQYLLHGLTQGYNVAIVASTLAIAALFLPLRRRIQTIIDLRFYRRKYDAARILAAFNATLRTEVDLSQLQAQLVAVVEETMQPAHVTVWLRNPKEQTIVSKDLV